jgi:hypothetical protein
MAVPHEKPRLLTKAGLARLPPVRRHFDLVGLISRSVVTEITLRFEATMFQTPGGCSC